MPLVYTQQHRPVTSLETREADGLSSRAYRDHARNANVAKGRTNPRHVWNVGKYPVAEFAKVAAPATYLTQGQVPARRGYDYYHINLWARLNAATAIPSLVRVYSDLRPYRGDGGTFDATLLTPMAQTGVVTISITADTFAWYEADIRITPSPNFDSNLIVTFECPDKSIWFGSIEAWYKELP